jgi:hypothetical protein
MHLSTVHNSNYYSGPSSAATNMTSTVPCFNMTMSSRIMRHCRPCTSINGTNATSVYAGPSSTHLFARNIDDRDSQGTHTMAIVGAILGIALGCLCVAAIWGWATKSNVKANKARKAALARFADRHGHNGNGGGFSEKGLYQGDGGLAAPSRSARSHGPRFLVRSQPAHSGRSNQSRGPYADGSRFSAVAGFEEGGSQGRGRSANGRSSSRRS